MSLPPGYKAPVHPSLVRPMLIAGAERSLVILEGTLVAALLGGIGFHPLILSFAALVVFGVHPLLVKASKSDPHIVRVYARSLSYQDRYLAAAHPLAPPARFLPFDTY